MTQPHDIKLGTAIIDDGGSGRRVMVAQLPGGGGRVVDLNRIELLRQTKLGEGRPDVLADALMPHSLRQLLCSGPRGIQRARHTLSYAEKWHQKSGLPEGLAPRPGSYRLLPCLPRPLSIRTSQGHFLDRLNVHGPGSTLPAVSDPTMAIVGSTDDKYAGYCIAATSPIGPVLGAWLCIGQLQSGDITVKIGANENSASIDAWADLIPPKLNPSEVFLLPPPMLRLPPIAPPEGQIVIETSFERLEICYGAEPIHPVVQ
ncbi:MAG: hypothetical protein FWG12_07685 [Holophagaceae bacterium]|nr:hypothetical protein [Holophagaceae bacterium]